MRGGGESIGVDPKGDTMLFQVALSLLMQMPQAHSSWAPQRHESYLCPPQVVQGSRSVVCCDTLEGKSCDETITSLLTPKQIQFLGDLTEHILALPEYKKAMPSCFSTSMALSDIPVKDAFLYAGDSDLVAGLAAYYEELQDPQQMQPGDVVVFDEQGMYLRMDDDELGRKTYTKMAFPRMFAHAMVYLGQGLVVQKENAATAVSSVTTLARSLQVYGDGLASIQHVKTLDYAYKETHLVLRVYRKK